MAQVEVKNLNNKVVEKLDLDPAVFEYQASDTLVWEAVNAFRAAQRKGTHSTKGRGVVRGSGRKPWRQKGTGRARVGTIRSPIWRKGGTVHGPQPRSYAQALPKKKRRGAVKRVLTARLESGNLVVVDDLSLESHRTKDFLKVLEALGLENKVLVVDERENRNLYLGSRNLPGVKMVPTLGVNIYDLVDHPSLLISKRSLLALQEVLTRSRVTAAAAEEGGSE
ncbi:MAG TPA: 50S ribosomal protein L4 [Acidobacteriota bacterium]|nr:50S ribosomal protein L4 [Acidobacteriota bacterium]